MWTDSPLLRDAGAAVLTGVAMAAVLCFGKEVANPRAAGPETLQETGAHNCRISVFPDVAFVQLRRCVCSISCSPYHHQFIINIIKVTVIGLGLVKDEGVVNSMTRHGNYRELLKSPLYYACAITLTTIVFWRTSPISIAVQQLFFKCC